MGLTAHAATLLPVLRRGEYPSPATVRLLDAAAAEARAGDVPYRNALYTALAEWIAADVRRFWRRAWQSSGDWDLEDVAQEAFFAFVDVVERWTGGEPFFDIFRARFPLRLTDAVRRLEAGGRIRFRVWHGAVGIDLLHDDSAAAAEGLALLEALAAQLPEPDGSILLWRVRDAEEWSTIARRLDVDRRWLHRRWVRICAGLRRQLELAGGAV
jgi:DNA-directed RNA polymerase specialized sigma24 family protein